jgi:hypothetical protein
MGGWKQVVFCGAIGALLLCVVAVDPALAAGEESKLGNALGGQIKAFGAAILLPVAWVTGLAAFGKREFGKVVVVAGVSLALTGFLIVPQLLSKMFEETWQSVA